MSNTSRTLAGTLCLTLVSAMPLVAQEPDAGFSFESCLAEADTSEQRKACYERLVTMMQDPRGLPLAMEDTRFDVILVACYAAFNRGDAEDSLGCGEEVAEVLTRIRTRALEALPPEVQERLAEIQASYDACVDEVYAEHGELTEEGFGACVEQRRVDALQAVTTASETWECYERVSRDRATPLVLLDGLLRMDSEVPNVGPGTVRLVGLVEHDARFGIAGLNRRWDFSLDEDGTYDFAIVIEPNGDGSYYDFSRVAAGESTSPSQLYSCERTGRE